MANASSQHDKGGLGRCRVVSKRGARVGEQRSRGKEERRLRTKAKIGRRKVVAQMQWRTRAILSIRIGNLEMRCMQALGLPLCNVLPCLSFLSFFSCYFPSLWDYSTLSRMMPCNDTISRACESYSS